jgi:hypothetical protein
MPSPRRVRRLSLTTPHRLPEFPPPPVGTDPELDRVYDSLLARDPRGEAFAAVLRETFDQLYDGQHTGRYSWVQLHKTEKTYMGTIVEINLQRRFNFDDGIKMDYLIEGVDTDCKYSQALGGWMIPPEAYEGCHLCLLVWANEESNRWEAGLIRARDNPGFLGAKNRDGKRPLTALAESQVRWLYDQATLPENLLLHIDQVTRDRIFNPSPQSRARPSGQARINMLFRLVQRRIVNRASVLTVAQQKDSLKRPRDARLPQHLGKEGILVLGHQQDDPLVAAALDLRVPVKGEFISARVFPAEDGGARAAAEIGGRRWRLAESTDPVVAAPRLRDPKDKDDENDDGEDDS